MPNRSSLYRVLAIILCLSFVLSGCGHISDNWTKPIGVTETTPKPTTVQPGQTQAPAQKSLVISEIMSNNVGSLTLPDDTTPDWIELYNTSDKPVSLNGYMISDNTKKPDKFVFKSGTVEAGGTLLVYASATDTDTIGGTTTGGRIHLPFGISSSGEELILTAPDGTVADQWTIPALPPDIAYGIQGKDTLAGAAKVYFGNPTPGKPNGTDGKPTADAAIIPAITTLLINEYCTRNATFYDEAGDYPDWVELYNSGDQPIDLSGYYLSDDVANSEKWQFPKTTLAPRSFLLLMLAGKTPGNTGTEQPATEGRLRVDFRLGADDTQLLISDTRGRTVASTELEHLPLNVSKGRLPDKPDTWAYFPRPTPGTPNTTVSFPSLALANSQASRSIFISEVFAQDGANTATPIKDWVELYNNTDQPIQLSGYGLSDNSGDPFRMKLGNLTVSPKSTVAIEPTTFSISATGETVLLTSPAGIIEDAFATGYLRAGTSSGRRIGTDATGGLDRFFYVTPMKNQVNTSTAYKTYTSIPDITVKSETGGTPVDNLYISGPVQVTIQTSMPDAKIYYTLDGHTPTASSTPYQGPVRVDRSLVVRAVAIAPGCLPSDVIGRTLLKETPHTLPVVSLSGSPEELTGAAQGILASQTATNEPRANFAFYETDGRLGIDFEVGLQLHGQFSRREAQKSLEVKIRSSYGNSEVTYPFFENYDVSTFRRLILRTSGQDWKMTKVRDAYMTQIVAGHVELETMAVRNCVVYVNGEYYGLYEIREKLDQFYVASHFGVDPDKVDMIKGTSAVVSGSNADYKELIAYTKAHSMNDPVAYKKVLDWVDEESLMDFVIVQSFFSNPDSGNKKFWRPAVEGGEYRYMLFDLDWAMFPSTYERDRLKGDLLDPAGHGQGNAFSTTLQVRLMENPEFEKIFVERYANFLNSIFKTDRMLKILDENVAIVEPEMARQIARWGQPSSMNSWKNMVATLRRITSEKRGLMITSLQQNFNLSQTRMKQLFPEDFQ